MQTKLSATSAGSSKRAGQFRLLFFLMLNPEDFYNLTSYASRFTQDPDRLVALYFSEVTVINRIELLEEANNPLFLKSKVSEIVKDIENDEVINPLYLIKELSLSSVESREDGIYADLSIYTDFVAYLMLSGIIR